MEGSASVSPTIGSQEIEVDRTEYVNTKWFVWHVTEFWS